MFLRAIAGLVSFGTFGTACSPTVPYAYRVSCPDAQHCSSPFAQPDTTLPVGSVIGLVVGWKPDRRAGDGSVQRLANAQVTAQPTGQQVVTSDSGEFLLTKLRPGYYVVTVRYIGYGQTAVRVQVPKHGGLRVILFVKAAPLFLSNDVFQ